MRRPSDAGFTLAETLVSIVLFGVVGIIVTLASVTGLHHQTQLQDRTDSTAQVRTALDRIDRDIRSANPLLSATSTQLVLNEVQPTVTRTITYTAAGNELTVTETDTTATGATSPTTKVLVSNLLSTTANPVFSFTPVPGYVAPVGSGVTAATCAMSGAAYDPGCIGTVTVHLAVQPPTVSTPISVSDNGTELRNAP